MHNSKLKRITVALCMALVPISVFAAGLGKLNVMSGLGEPLKADIELISVTPEELSSISAVIASEEAYAIQGIEKPASHNTIKVNVSKNSAGDPILKLNSSQPISEPFLDMLIQVDWASGRLLREYTVLLDPPGYTGEADSNAQTAQTPLVQSFSKNKKANSENILPDDNVPADVMPADDTTISNKITKNKTVADTQTNNELSGDEYQTQRGDTLAKIARDMKPEGVSLEQMLIGLYQTNPEAFQGNNINRLKVGQILRQPSQDTLNSISNKDASNEVKVQAANWNAYRNKLAGIVAESTPADSEASTQSAGGKIKSAEDKSEAASTGPKDVVKLSAGEVATQASSEDIKSLQAKITALQEEAVAREKSVKEAESRTADLEKQIADMQKLLAMKNGAMADIQKQAEAAPTANPVEAVKPTEETKPVAETKPAEPVTAAPATDDNKPKPAITTAEIAPVEEPSFLAGMMDGLNLNILAPAGGLLALLGGGWLYLRKKREKNLADFEQGIMTSGGLKANTVFGNTASASVDTGDTSFLTDFSQSANGGMIDTNDVDPIAEAEVYMAYGRDAQAEEILKDAITKEPKRHELHLKLLEMYAASKSLSAFETIAGELYTSLGAEDPMWAKVAEIGIKLEPNNPLYQANSAPTGLGGSLDAGDFAGTPLAAEKDLDFSFDNESLVQNFAAESAPASDEAATEIEKMDDAVDSDLPQFDSDNAAETVDLTEPPAEVNTNDALDFDMGDFGAKTADAVESTAQASFGNTMPALDMPTFETPKFIPDALADEAELDTDNVLDISGLDTEDLNANFDANVLDISATAGDNVEAPPAFDDLNAESFGFMQTDAVTADVTNTEPVLDISGMDTEVANSDFSADADFSFDIETISPEVAENTEDTANVLNSVDLNAIDLSLNDGNLQASVNEADLNTIADPIEVETKLDLVAAYIEMDDKEGAKELLDEVMKEGGAGQRKRAEALLAQIS